jgi:hypothetical protein
VTRRLFVDENIPPLVAISLAKTFPAIEFVSAHDDPHHYCGVDDLELFPRIAAAGFQGIITQDKNQLREAAEREALRAHHLHWIGCQSKGHAGVRGIALNAATLIAGFPFVIEHWGQVPHIYHLKGVHAELGQRAVIKENT